MKVCFPALLSLCVATVVWAQAPPAKGDAAAKPDARLKFDISAIRPHVGGRGTVVLDGQGDGGRFSANNITLRQLIALAYHFQPNQISGGPAWINTTRFDVEAKPEEGFVPTPEETQEMLQSLLEDRFQLKVQNQTKPGPVYELVVSKGGPKIKLSADQTPPPARPQGLRPGRGGFGGGAPGGGAPGGGAPGGGGPGGGRAAGGGGRGGFQGGRGGGAGAGAPVAGPAPAQGTPPAGGTTAVAGQDNRPGGAGGPRRGLDRPLPRGQVMMNPGLLRGSAVTVEQILRPMGNQLGRPVIDHTNLKGLYDVQMTFAPIRNDGLPNNSFRQDGPVIFTAIQEQLGLKLESATGPIDALLVEKAEEPGEN